MQANRNIRLANGCHNSPFMANGGSDRDNLSIGHLTNNYFLARNECCSRRQKEKRANQMPSCFATFGYCNRKNSWFQFGTSKYCG